MFQFSELQLINSGDVIVGSLLRSVSFQCRFMFGLAAVPSFIRFFGFLFMPDTPRWLITRGRFDKARAVLHRIHGTSVNIEQEITDINNSIKQCAENRELYTIHVLIMYTMTFFTSCEVVWHIISVACVCMSVCLSVI